MLILCVLRYQLYINLFKLFAKLLAPVLSLSATAGLLLHVFVQPTTLITQLSPQVSWSKVQLELLELQVVITPLLSTADTTWVWSGPEFLQVTKALLVLHFRFTNTLSGLHGAEDEEVDKQERWGVRIIHLFNYLQLTTICSTTTHNSGHMHMQQ